MHRWFIPSLALSFILGAAGFLSFWKTHQRLGQPGLIVSKMDSGTLKIEFPEKVMDYTSQPVEIGEPIRDALPSDTTLDVRLYKAPDAFELRMMGVLMGTDRTSIHQPEFCLTGSGYHIVDTIVDSIKITYDKTEETDDKTYEETYELPVMILKSHKEHEGVLYTGYYIYWFVAEGLATAEHWERMWWMAKGLFTTGELQRWAYVSCFSICLPEREKITLVRMKSFLEKAIPQFQSPLLTSHELL